MSEINSNRIETSSDQQRILVTGVSGLIGQVIFNYLTKTYPTKYQVFGLDQHMKPSSRYQLETNDDSNFEPTLNLPSDRFFQCDITDRTKLHHFIEEQKIEIIIHLAAVLENHPDIEKISRVNIDGAKNVFEARQFYYFVSFQINSYFILAGVRRIIYASSVMTVFGYLTREPYLSISNETFDDTTMLQNLRKLTVTDDPPLPYLSTPGDLAYCQSKIIGEQIALSIVKNTTKSIICARLGWVNIEDQPGKGWLRTVWFSHRDFCSFIDKALQAPLHISGIYFTMSNNHRLWVDIDDAKRDFDFVPQDGAEKL
jgi:nucleoside-diphosphate-sugar epimerase